VRPLQKKPVLTELPLSICLEVNRKCLHYLTYVDSKHSSNDVRSTFRAQVNPGVECYKDKRARQGSLVGCLPAENEGEQHTRVPLSKETLLIFKNNTATTRRGKSFSLAVDNVCIYNHNAKKEDFRF
jgi:hypothetical protein